MKDGFVLKKFEVFNWGTFDGEVETYYLDGDITVVSGDNGSGKSTVVDALVSLIVPGRMRKYNLSATEGSKKKSRNEMTYIRGAYKNEETEQGVQTAYLRGNKAGESTFSVILGYFKNESTNKEITLATFFRTTSNGIDKFYIVSDVELFLREDFVNIVTNYNTTNPVSKLKNHLKIKLKTRIYNKFNEYEQDFSSIFGLRQNAIELFNKVVSLKEIKDLNSFFRENMLENNPHILAEFEECEKNYLGVQDIYEKIIESEEKLKILTPFIENKKKYDLKIVEKDKILYYEQNLKNYSVGIESGLNKDKIKKEINLLDIVKIEKKELENKIILEINEIKSVEKLLEDSDITKRIKEIEQTLEILYKEGSLREINKINYINYINVLGFDFSHSEENFKENIIKINDKKTKLDLENSENEELKIEHLSKNKELLQIRDEKDNELNYLQKRENLLPERLSKIRQKIANSLNIDENKLMFVCELIKVKEEEQDWTMSIEKLLHSFGQEMLVPEEHLNIVNDFVNKNNLKGKLKYNKIKKDFLLGNYDESEINIYSKIDIKHNSEFHNWIKDKILTRFNYICLEEVSTQLYYSSPLVLTISGLIKNKNSYLKDDREFSMNNYILGWDNKAKIKLLEKEINGLNKNISDIKQKIDKLNKFRQDYDKFSRIFSKFEDIKTFSSIDYDSIKIDIETKNIEITNLKENDSELKSYREKLAKLKNTLEELNKKRDSKLGKINILENDINKLEIRKNKIEELLKDINLEEINHKFEKSKYYFIEITLDNLEIQKESNSEKITNKKDRIIDEIQTLSNKLNGLSISYREHKMSVGEKNELGVNISNNDIWTYLEKEYHKINDEELYKYKEKFEKEFRETLFIRLNDFYNSLENESEYIKEKIETINRTLKTINYSKTTFIEVDIKDNEKKSDGIVEFKKDFREKIINKRELDMTDKIKAFEDIKTLMEKLIDKDMESWRNNMIDVRNWFIFRIKENYRESLDTKDIFESSSGKSGGQTIKLAYSVLAAALLYQFGIKEENQNLITNNFSKSFRLVVIDEVFAKLDIDNSKYVLELFKSLNLQLFIITPSNTINILEDHVDSIYFIANRTGDKSIKEKLSIKTRQIIPEKVIKKPENNQEKDFLKREAERKKDF